MEVQIHVLFTFHLFQMVSSEGVVTAIIGRAGGLSSLVFIFSYVCTDCCYIKSSFMKAVSLPVTEKCFGYFF